MNKAIQLFLQGMSIQQATARATPGCGGPNLMRAQTGTQAAIREYVLTLLRTVQEQQERIQALENELRAARRRAA